MATNRKIDWEKHFENRHQQWENRQQQLENRFESILKRMEDCLASPASENPRSFVKAELDSGGASSSAHNDAPLQFTPEFLGQFGNCEDFGFAHHRPEEIGHRNRSGELSYGCNRFGESSLHRRTEQSPREGLFSTVNERGCESRAMEVHYSKVELEQQFNHQNQTLLQRFKAKEIDAGYSGSSTGGYPPFHLESPVIFGNRTGSGQAHLRQDESKHDDGVPLLNHREEITQLNRPRDAALSNLQFFVNPQRQQEVWTGESRLEIALLSHRQASLEPVRDDFSDSPATVFEELHQVDSDHVEKDALEICSLEKLPQFQLEKCSEQFNGVNNLQMQSETLVAGFQLENERKGICKVEELQMHSPEKGTTSNSRAIWCFDPGISNNVIGGAYQKFGFQPRWRDENALVHQNHSTKLEANPKMSAGEVSVLNDSSEPVHTCEEGNPLITLEHRDNDIAVGSLQCFDDKTITCKSLNSEIDCRLLIKAEACYDKHMKGNCEYEEGIIDRGPNACDELKQSKNDKELGVGEKWIKSIKCYDPSIFANILGYWNRFVSSEQREKPLDFISSLQKVQCSFLNILSLYHSGNSELDIYKEGSLCRGFEKFGDVLLQSKNCLFLADGIRQRWMVLLGLCFQKDHSKLVTEASSSVEGFLIDYGLAVKKEVYQLASSWKTAKFSRNNKKWNSVMMISEQQYKMVSSSESFKHDQDEYDFFSSSYSCYYNIGAAIPYEIKGGNLFLRKIWIFKGGTRSYNFPFDACGVNYFRSLKLEGKLHFERGRELLINKGSVADGVREKMKQRIFPKLKRATWLASMKVCNSWATWSEQNYSLEVQISEHLTEILGKQKHVAALILWEMGLSIDIGLQSDLRQEKNTLDGFPKIMVEFSQFNAHQFGNNAFMRTSMDLDKIMVLRFDTCRNHIYDEYRIEVTRKWIDSIRIFDPGILVTLLGWLRAWPVHQRVHMRWSHESLSSSVYDQSRSLFLESLCSSFVDQRYSRIIVEKLFTRWGTICWLSPFFQNHGMNLRLLLEGGLRK